MGSGEWWSGKLRQRSETICNNVAVRSHVAYTSDFVLSIQSSQRTREGFEENSSDQSLHFTHSLHC